MLSVARARIFRESSANLPRIFRESSPQAFIHTYSWKAGEWSLIVIARRFSAHVMPFSCAWLQPWCSRTPRSSCVEDSAKMHAYPVPLSALQWARGSASQTTELQAALDAHAAALRATPALPVLMTAAVLAKVAATARQAEASSDQGEQQAH
eukprot:3050340-Pleurochrysis_carterae.AAC.1